MSKIKGKIDKLLNEARAFLAKEPARGVLLCKEALQLCRENNMENEEGEVLLQQILCYRMVSMYEEALDCAAKARSIFTRLGNESGLMRLNNFIGILYFYNGIYDRSIYHLTASYDVAKMIDNKTMMIKTLNNIGEVHKKVGDYNDAMFMYEKAAKLSKESNIDESYGVIIQNIGDIYMIEGNLEKAEECFHMAYSCFLDQDRDLHLSELNLNLGRLYLKSGQPSRARSYFDSAIESLNEINNRFYIIEVLIELYHLDCTVDPKLAFEHLLRAQRLALEARIELKLSDVELLMHKHYEKNGDYERALYHFKTYHNLLQKLEANNLILKLKILKLESTNQNSESSSEHISDLMSNEIEHEREKIKVLESENAALSHKAMHDQLTKLPNRRRINSELEKIAEYVKMKDGHANVGVFMLDIDHFKRVNDNMGHLFGDHCLDSIGKALKKIAMKYNGFVGRFGGEEFIYLQMDLDLYGANKIGQELNTCVRNLEIEYMIDNEHKRLTISVGGLYCENLSRFDKNMLIELADKALYVGKAEGRDQSVLHIHEEVRNLAFKEVIN